MNLSRFLTVFIILCISCDSFARNYYSGKKVTRVFDERPQNNRVVVSIDPPLYECSSIKFILGEQGMTDNHLDRVHGVAMAALLADKAVGGLWDDPGQGCKGTNIHISK